MLSSALLLPGLRRQLDRPFRLALVLAGIALGAALITFITLVNQATVRSFELSVNELAGDTDLIVTSMGGESFSEGVLDRVLRVKGVRSAVPVIQNKTFVHLGNGDRRPMTALGIDLLNDSSVRSKNDAGTRIVSDPLAFMADPGHVALTRSFAARNGFGLGDTVQLVTTRGVKGFRVGALIGDQGPGKSFGGTLLVMDIEASRLSFGKPGKVDQINVVVEDSGSIRSVARGIQDALDESFSIDPPSGQVQSLREVVEPFQKLLLYLGVLACIMAFFLIVSTARVSIAERKAEIGVLRALGMEKSRILVMILVEYALIGIVGSVVGAFLACVFGGFFVDSIQQGMAAEAQAAIDFRGSILDLRVPAAVSVIGAAVTVLAVFGAVRGAIEVSPVEAIYMEKAEDEKRALSKGRGALYLAGAASLLPLFFMGARSTAAVQLAPILGALVCAPMLAVWLLRGARPLVERLPFPLLTLAWSYAVEKPRRVERTVRALVVGLLLVFVISSVQDGFMSALAGKFLNTARPEFYVTSNGVFNTPETLQRLDESIKTELATVRGVRGVYGQQVATVRYRSKKIKLDAYDEAAADVFKVPYSWFEVVDRPVAEAGLELYHGDPRSIFVSESFTALYGKRTGDSIDLEVLDHKESFKIVGVVRDLAAGGGKVYMSRARYKALWKDPLVAGVGFVLHKGADLDVAKREVEDRFGRSHGLIVTVDKGNEKQIEAVLRKSFFSLHCIELVCIVVAALGFISSFLIDVQNRAHELAILRVVGTSKRELAFFMFSEAALLGLGAGLMVLLFAVPISWSVISRTLPSVFGWVVEFELNKVLCLAVLALAVVVAGVSSLFSIRWSWGLDAAEATRYE